MVLALGAKRWWSLALVLALVLEVVLEQVLALGSVRW